MCPTKLSNDSYNYDDESAPKANVHTIQIKLSESIKEHIMLNFDTSMLDFDNNMLDL